MGPEIRVAGCAAAEVVPEIWEKEEGELPRGGRGEVGVVAFGGCGGFGFFAGWWWVGGGCFGGRGGGFAFEGRWGWGLRGGWVWE